MKLIEAYGLSRNRDKTGKVVSRHLNEYVNCIHTQVGGGSLYFLDTYNQAVHENIVTAIRTNINTANHHFIIERYEDPNTT